MSTTTKKKAASKTVSLAEFASQPTRPDAPFHRTAADGTSHRMPTRRADADDMSWALDVNNEDDTAMTLGEKESAMKEIIRKGKAASASVFDFRSGEARAAAASASVNVPAAGPYIAYFKNLPTLSSLITETEEGTCLATYLSREFNITPKRVKIFSRDMATFGFLELETATDLRMLLALKQIFYKKRYVSIDAANESQRSNPDKLFGSYVPADVGGAASTGNNNTAAGASHTKGSLSTATATGDALLTWRSSSQPTTQQPPQPPTSAAQNDRLYNFGAFRNASTASEAKAVPPTPPKHTTHQPYARLQQQQNQHDSASSWSLSRDNMGSEQQRRSHNTGVAPTTAGGVWGGMIKRNSSSSSFMHRNDSTAPAGSPPQEEQPVVFRAYVGHLHNSVTADQLRSYLCDEIGLTPLSVAPMKLSADKTVSTFVDLPDDEQLQHLLSQSGKHGPDVERKLTMSISRPRGKFAVAASCAIPQQGKKPQAEVLSPPRRCSFKEAEVKASSPPHTNSSRQAGSSSLAPITSAGGSAGLMASATTNATYNTSSSVAAEADTTEMDGALQPTSPVTTAAATVGANSRANTCLLNDEDGIGVLPSTRTDEDNACEAATNSISSHPSELRSGESSDDEREHTDEDDSNSHSHHNPFDDADRQISCNVYGSEDSSAPATTPRAMEFSPQRETFENYAHEEEEGEGEEEDAMGDDPQQTSDSSAADTSKAPPPPPSPLCPSSVSPSEQIRYAAVVADAANEGLVHQVPPNGRVNHQPPARRGKPPAAIDASSTGASSTPTAADEAAGTGSSPSQQQPQRPRHCVYIGNLPTNTTEAEVGTYLADLNLTVRIVRIRVKGPATFAFVDLGSAAELEYLIAQRGLQFGGRSLRIVSSATASNSSGGSSPSPAATATPPAASEPTPVNASAENKQEKPATPAPPLLCAYIGNLPTGTTQQGLRTFLEDRIGRLKYSSSGAPGGSSTWRDASASAASSSPTASSITSIALRTKTGASSGVTFAFVNVTAADDFAALMALEGNYFLGRRLRVYQSQPQSPAPAPQ